jgi:hypothetical protein
MRLLSATINANATIPNDRIIGMLGLVEETTQKLFIPGADWSVRDLYTAASRFLLRDEPITGKSYPLRLLAHVKHFPLEEGEQERRNEADRGLMPSWVKRWHDPIPVVKPDREENEVQPMFIISQLPYTTKFCTGGSVCPKPEFNPVAPYEISLRGFIFTTISNTVNILRLPPLSRSQLWDFILDIRSIRKEREFPYPTGESIDEAFALTLTMADNIHYTHGPETYHGIDFQHFCASLYEQTLTSLTRISDIKSLKSLKTEWEAEYQRLKSLVGTHVKSPTFSSALQLSCPGRKLFGTSTGHIGIGDVTLEPKDLVCVFLGGKTPFIIRPVGDKYRFVGECYLHGIMFGGALKEGLQKLKLITLI